MPHLHIEYTANLDGIDQHRVLTAAMEALAAQGLYDMPTAKRRIRRLDQHAVDHPDNGSGFVAITLAILPGRRPEERSRTSLALTDAVAVTIPQCAGTQVRTEIRELDPYGYTGRDL
jgi:5-carboxymethyl-2-hydroxymuconate isomerase